MWLLEARTGDSVTLPAGWRPGQRREVHQEDARRLLDRYPNGLFRAGTAVLAGSSDLSTPWVSS